ncbi:hypothetical protein Tamer19_13500 [Cupriavidus sp. TA19]|uniref:hypothetical protein n=1 Tax=unclassified Cupriavidus TaxID=2640874 RepID=UPI00272946E5|nr:hypothetical protein [Cupriavidus sp. TA19]GLC91942.1 hypothetical protein Tamer19_13500 [Cupriavidus sp. TA19]
MGKLEIKVTISAAATPALYKRLSGMADLRQRAFFLKQLAEYGAATVPGSIGIPLAHSHTASPAPTPFGPPGRSAAELVSIDTQLSSVPSVKTPAPVPALPPVPSTSVVDEPEALEVTASIAAAGGLSALTLDALVAATSRFDG